MSVGFRVFGIRDARSDGEARIVAYRLEPSTLAFSDVTGKAGRLFGFPREEWRRPDFFFDRLHPDDVQAAREFYRDWQKSDRRSHELQYRLIDAAGRVRRVYDILEVSGDEAGGEEMRGVLVDVTGRIVGGAEGEALRLRGELMRITGEELRQPVRAIAAFSDMLGRHLSAQRDDVGSDYAIGIRDGVQRLDSVTARLLRATQSAEMSLDEMTTTLASIRTVGREPD